MRQRSPCAAAAEVRVICACAQLRLRIAGDVLAAGRLVVLACLPMAAECAG